jgi:hypothetical protein
LAGSEPSRTRAAGGTTMAPHRPTRTQAGESADEVGAAGPDDRRNEASARRR